MKKRSSGVLVLFAIVAGLWSAQAFSSSSFEPTTFNSFERTRPSKESVRGFEIDSSRPGLLLVVSQSCDVRVLSDEKKAFLHHLGVAFGKPEVFAQYTRELHVEERGVGRWVPFQDDTIDHLMRSSCEASEIGITVRYLAVHSELGRIYAGIGYSRTALQRPKPASCFATELLGVKIGASLRDERSRLATQYGHESSVPQSGERRLWAYQVDDEHQTTLLIGDSGNGPRQRVFSVQVWGAPNPGLELPRGLRLGQASSTVFDLLGTPASRKNKPDGFELLSFEGSLCSVELRDGVLASVVIVGDPNYFEECHGCTRTEGAGMCCTSSCELPRTPVVEEE